MEETRFYVCSHHFDNKYASYFVHEGNGIWTQDFCQATAFSREKAEELARIFNDGIDTHYRVVLEAVPARANFDKDQAQRKLRVYSTNAVNPGEVYRHYKGGLYSIVAISVKEDTLETLVTYHSNAKSCNWSRTATNFLEKVTVDGKEISRFTRVKD